MFFTLGLLDQQNPNTTLILSEIFLVLPIPLVVRFFTYNDSCGSFTFLILVQLIGQLHCTIVCVYLAISNKHIAIKLLALAALLLYGLARLIDIYYIFRALEIIREIKFFENAKKEYIAIISSLVLMFAIPIMDKFVKGIFKAIKEG